MQDTRVGILSHISLIQAPTKKNEPQHTNFKLLWEMKCDYYGIRFFGGFPQNVWGFLSKSERLSCSASPNMNSDQAKFAVSIAKNVLFRHVVVVCALYMKQLHFVSDESAKEGACYERGR